jgi:uncharacterized protein (UPF0332 family)
MENKLILIKNWLDKAEQALKAAQDNINLNNLETAQNRIYYSIFYAVSALSKSKDFVTSKHHQLLGWFNREFVKQGTIKKEIAQIYSDSFEFRQKTDYTISFIPEKEKIEQMLEEAKIFIDEIKKII